MRRLPAVGLFLMALSLLPAVLVAYGICEIGEYGDCDYDRTTPLAIGVAAVVAALVAGILNWRGTSRWSAILAVVLTLAWVNAVFF